jgi:cyclic pyranopterin phosphate synthase
MRFKDENDKDTFGRVHGAGFLTDNCNLRCFYCIPEKKICFITSVQVDEIETIAKLFGQQMASKNTLDRVNCAKDAPKLSDL